MAVLGKLLYVGERINMNKGTEDLKQVLKILDGMSVEGYEELYDEVCAKYGDTEPLCVLDDSLDTRSLSTQLYNADDDVESLSSMLNARRTSKDVRSERENVAIHINMRELFYKVTMVNVFFSQPGNKVKYYASR